MKGFAHASEATHDIHEQRFERFKRLKNDAAFPPAWGNAALPEKPGQIIRRNKQWERCLITDTILRDAHQSQAATRMRLEEMLPVADKLDKIGYYSLECWGGATFDSCMRFLNEDPWERLRALRKAMPNTKLQMLFRGQNILGYKHYADDVVDEFVKKSIENGIDIIRIFDALNDLRNLEQAVKSTKKYGGNCEIAISYTISPVHTEEYFLKLAKEIEQMGADAICIKDMANLLLPYEAYSLVKKLKATTKLPIHLHTHNTAGTGAMTILKAIEAGCDIVDTALSPMAEGTSQPATESLCATLKGTEYDPCLDHGADERVRDALPRCGRPSGEGRLARAEQGAARGCQHAEVSGAGRHALQHDRPAQAVQRDGQVLRRAG